MLRIADLTNCRTADHRHPAQFTGSKTQGCKSSLPRNQLHARTGTARDLGALPGPELDAVYRRADRYIAQRQAIAWSDRRTTARHQLVAGRDAARGDDVASLTIRIQQQRDMGATIRIVLDPLDLCGNSVLCAPEVHDSITLLVPATSVAGRDSTLVVASTGAALLGEQRPVRISLVQTFRLDRNDEPPAGRGWLCLNHSHGSVLRRAYSTGPMKSMS